MHVLVHVIK